MILLGVAILGGLGAATRFVVDGLIRSGRPRAFPLATLVINVSGSAVIGLLSGAVLYHSLPMDLYTLVAVGFCGGYTTFSTAMVETVRLAQAGDTRRAVGNALGSLVLALAAATLGVVAMWLVP